MRDLKKRILAFLLIFVMLIPIGGCEAISELAETIGITQPTKEPDYIKVTYAERVFENHFYYDSYTAQDQKTYRDIYQGLMEQRDEFIIHSNDGSRANEILYTVLYDFPEIFWAEGYVVSTTYGDVYVKMEPQYTCSMEERASKQEYLDQATELALASAPEGNDEYAKIKYVYEYLVNSVEYEDGASDNQNLYSSMVNKKTVCAGYAKACQYLLGKLGVWCTYITGEATNSQGTQLHAWNMVKCNQNYYYVDVTWADPVYVGEGVNSSVTINYDYLCCTDEALANSHQKKDIYEYPECNADDLNYYKNQGMYYNTANANQLLNAMKADIRLKKQTTTLKFSDEQVYAQGRNMILDDVLNEALRYLRIQYGLKNAKCSYREETINRFVIYWLYE